MCSKRRRGFYELYVKRCFDIVCAIFVLLLFGWLYIIISVMVFIKLGRPILFKQARPGIIDSVTGKETIFAMYKFRSMTNEKDKKGNLLPDKMRLGKFGKMLRATSMDELPEIYNVLKGDMSFIGPRPQLVRDMVFMSNKQRMRHTAKPGISGLAQVRGRNAITWEDKIDWDLKYISNISFINDLRIVFETVRVAIIHQEGITDGKNATALDYGDALLETGKISKSEYEKKQKEAKRILEEFDKGNV